MQFFHNNFLRFITCLLIVVILTNLLLPKIAGAEGDSMFFEQIVQYIQALYDAAKQYNVQNITKYYNQITSQIQQWTKKDTLNQRSLNQSWNQTRAQLLKQLSSDVLKWAQGTNGNTNFVQDWQGFLNKQTNTTNQDFINSQINQAPTCSTFGQAVKQAVSAGNNPSLATQTQCPMSDPNALNNCTSQDFWSDFDNMLRPAGNPMGLYMVMSDALLQNSSLAYTSQLFKLTANQGYQGDASKGTPGIIQSYAAQRASMMDFDYLLSSPNIDQYYSSLVDAFINRIKNEGLANMQTDACSTSDSNNNSNNSNCYQYHPDQIYKPTIPQDSQDINEALASENHAKQLMTLLNAINQEYPKQLGELKSNLEVLNKVKDAFNTCGQSPADAQSEINLVNADITNIEQNKIPQVLQAISDLGNLNVQIEAVASAQNTGSQSDLDAARQAYVDARTPAIASLDALLETKTQDIPALHDEATAFLQNLTQKTSDCTNRRGEKNVRGTKYLYGWLLCLVANSCSATLCPSTPATTSCRGNTGNGVNTDNNGSSVSTTTGQYSQEVATAVKLNQEIASSGSYGYISSYYQPSSHDYLLPKGQTVWFLIDPVGFNIPTTGTQLNIFVLDYAQGVGTGVIDANVYSIDNSDNLLWEQDNIIAEVNQGSVRDPYWKRGVERFLIKVWETGKADTPFSVYWGAQ